MRRAVDTDRAKAGASRLLAGVVALIPCVLLGVLLSGCQAQTPAGPLAERDYVPLPVEAVETRTVPLAGVVEPPENGAFIGVFKPPAPFKAEELDAYREISDKHPAVLMWFQPWAESGANQFDTAAVVATLRAGTIPMITWEPWNPGVDSNLVKNPGEQPEYKLQRIIDGEFDDYIREWARAIRNVGGPVMLRPMHEMNGDWYPWGAEANGNTPVQFIAAWRHVHDLFEEEGATNVTWVWSVNRTSHPDVRENRPAALYPGDDYVDWTAMSGFNWGTTRQWMTWMTFDDLYEEPIKFLESVGKPIAISEFGSVEVSGDKAEWIEDAYERIRIEHPLVGIVVYYDNPEKGLKGEQDWQIASSPESLAAYQEAVSDPYYVAAPAPTLEEWAKQMTAADWAYLTRVRRIY